MEPRRFALVVLFLVLPAISACGSRFKLKAVKAARTQVESTVSTVSSGTVDAEQMAVLGFSAVGRIAQIQVRLGTKVKRGQLLAELENADLKSIFGEADAELSRAKELFAEGLVSKAALDAARRGFEVARANLDKTIIRAPFDGIITEMNLELGELSQATGTTAGGKSALRVVDLKPRLVKGEIDEIDLAKVRPGAKARVRIQAARAEPFEAVVNRVVPFVSTTKEQDRSSQIELRLKDTDLQIPVGASADVEIITESKTNVLAVPSRVILGKSDDRYLYRLDGSKIYKTPIKKGLGNYDRTEILTGIKEGDVVVYPSEDVEFKDGMKVNAEVQTWPLSSFAESTKAL